MGKKLIIGITIVLITGLFTGWYFFSREAKYLGTSAFQAIPENSALIVRIHHLKNYASRTLNNPIWKACSAFPGIDDLYQKSVFADSLFKQYNNINNPFTDKDLTIVCNRENDHFRTLYLTELSSFSEKGAVADLIRQFFQSKGATINKIQSGGAEITGYSWSAPGAPQTNYFVFFRGLLLAGSDTAMIQQAIRQLNHPTTNRSTVFEKASKTATENIDLNIYINHQKLPGFSRTLFSKPFRERLNGAAPLAEWSEIDLTQKTDDLILNGFSFTGDSLNNHLSIFSHQQPDTFKLTSLFPATSTFFLGYTISDNEKFFADYENLLQHNRQLEPYTRALHEVDSIYGINLQKIVATNLGGAAAMVFTRPDPVIREENKYLVLSVGNSQRMEQDMLQLIKPLSSHQKRGLSKDFQMYKIDKANTFRIYNTPVNDFGKRVFGAVFSDVVTSYFTFFGNNMIMGASSESIKRFLMSNVLKATLGNDPNYRKFNAGLSDRLNVTLWSSPGYSLPFFKEMFNPSIFEGLEKKGDELKKIESLGWQIGFEKGMTYNMARLRFNPGAIQNPVALSWSTELKGAVINRPQFMISTSGKSGQEIVAQDGDHNFILLNGEGHLLWKIKLKGAIQSEIFRTDCFKNGKLQYFFSTAEALHLIDHEGKYIANFPVALRSTATNGVAMFDYDQNRDYRFIIAAKDHKIYSYNKKGEMTTGWSSPRTEHEVVKPVQFFRTENKDYIVVADKNRGYLLDRKGKTAATIRGNLNFSRNPLTFQPKSGKLKARLISTDTKGNILSIGFDGSVKKLATGKFSPDHYFFYEDIDGDNRSDYLFFNGDSLVAYNQNITRILTRRFNHAVVLTPGLLTFPDKTIKIGVTDTIDHKIYLFNSDGSGCEGFPINGNTPFDTAFSRDGSGSFNLIAGTPENYLNNYTIK